jgi:hypothetical protein
MISDIKEEVAAEAYLMSNVSRNKRWTLNFSEYPLLTRLAAPCLGQLGIL